MNVAELTQKKVSKLKIQVTGGAWQGSVSVGVATKTQQMQRPEDLLKVANIRVYAAKST